MEKADVFHNKYVVCLNWHAQLSYFLVLQAGQTETDCLYTAFVCISHLPFQMQTGQFHFCFYQVLFSGSHRLLFLCEILQTSSDSECPNRDSLIEMTANFQEVQSTSLRTSGFPKTSQVPPSHKSL